MIEFPSKFSEFRNLVVHWGRFSMFLRRKASMDIRLPWLSWFLNIIRESRPSRQAGEMEDLAARRCDGMPRIGGQRDNAFQECLQTAQAEM